MNEIVPDASWCWFGDPRALWSAAGAWPNAVEIVSDSVRQNVRPFFVRGAPAGLNWRLMWLEGTYGDFDRFRMRLVGTR